MDEYREYDTVYIKFKTWEHNTSSCLKIYFFCSGNVKKCKCRTVPPSMEQRAGGYWEEYAKRLTSLAVFYVLGTRYRGIVALFISFCMLNIVECYFL